MSETLVQIFGKNGLSRTYNYKRQRFQWRVSTKQTFAVFNDRYSLSLFTTRWCNILKSSIIRRRNLGKDFSDFSFTNFNLLSMVRPKDTRWVTDNTFFPFFHFLRWIIWIYFQPRFPGKFWTFFFWERTTVRRTLCLEGCQSNLLKIVKHNDWQNLSCEKPTMTYCYLKRSN